MFFIKITQKLLYCVVQSKRLRKNPAARTIMEKMALAEAFSEHIQSAGQSTVVVVVTDPAVVVVLGAAVVVSAIDFIVVVASAAVVVTRAAVVVLAFIVVVAGAAVVVTGAVVVRQQLSGHSSALRNGGLAITAPRDRRATNITDIFIILLSGFVFFFFDWEFVSNCLGYLLYGLY